MERVIEKNEISKLKEYFELLVENKPWVRYNNIFETYNDNFYILLISIINNDKLSIDIKVPIHKVSYIQQRSEKTMENMKRTILEFLEVNEYFENFRKFIVYT